MTITRAGILIFTAAVFAGPWYTVAEYDPLTHVISLLGAQSTPYSFIMVAGFLALGLCILIDGMREFKEHLNKSLCDSSRYSASLFTGGRAVSSIAYGPHLKGPSPEPPSHGLVQRFLNKPVIPFMAFGIFMGLAGLLAHKPLAPELAHSDLMHQAHSLLATLAGISITVGLLWQTVLLPASWRRVMTLLLAVLCFALPLSMLAFEDSQGLIQRCMYLLIFAWLWIYYPTRLQKSRGHRRLHS